MLILALSPENERPTWKMNITKMGKVLEKCMIIFPKIFTEKRTLS